MKSSVQSINRFRSRICFASVCSILAIVAACTREAGVQPPRTPGLSAPTQFPQVTDQTFEQEVLEHPVPVVVIMSTKWCPECVKLKPDLKDLVVEFDHKVRFLEVDVERNRFLAEKYEITQYPTLLVLVNGKVYERLDGKVEAANLAQCLTMLLIDDCDSPNDDR